MRFARYSILRLAVGLSLLLAACATGEAAEGPPEINLGRDICIECGMIIDDPRFAAAYRTADGTEKLFDDLGGLLLYGSENDELEMAEVWVSDFEEEALIEAESAYFLPTAGVASPMGYGILAFGDRDTAEEFASDIDGEVLTWDQARQLTVIEGQVVHQHHEMDHNDDMTDGEEMDSDG